MKNRKKKSGNWELGVGNRFQPESPQPAANYSFNQRCSPKKPTLYSPLPTPKRGFEQGSLFPIIILSLISCLLYLGCAFEAEESQPDLNAPDRPGVTPGEKQLVLRWTHIDTATGYELWYSTGEAGDRVNWQTFNPKDQITIDESLVKITMTGLYNGKEYWVWTKAIYPRGTSDYSEGASGTPLEKPGVPTNLTTEAGDEFFTAKWRKAIGRGGPSQSYDIYYSTSSTTPEDTDVEITTSGIETDSGIIQTIVPGVPNDSSHPYYVWVRAVNTAGHSAWTGPEKVTLKEPLGPPTAEQLDFDLYPRNKRLTVDWTPVTGDPFVSRFKVYYSGTDPNITNWDDFKQTPEELLIKSSMSTTINSLTNGNCYYVYIRTGNSKGYNESGFSPKSGVPNPKTPAINLNDNNFEVCEITAAFVNAENGKGDRLARKQETEYSNLIGDALVWWAGENYPDIKVDFGFYNGGLIIDAIGLPKKDKNGNEVTDPDEVGIVKIADIKVSIKTDKISIIRLRGDKMKRLFDYVAQVLHDGSGKHGTGYFGQVSQECSYTIDYTSDPLRQRGQIPWGTDDAVKISGEPIDPPQETTTQ